MEVVLVAIDFVLLFQEVVVFGGEEWFERHPCAFCNGFASPLFACIIVQTAFADGMISCLYNFEGCEWDLSIGCELYAIIDVLEVDINWLSWVHWCFHLRPTICYVGCGDASVSFQEMVDEISWSDSHVACVSIVELADVRVCDGVNDLYFAGVVHVVVVFV
jgi:hypothetical protein